jgi:hypothetical protein
MARQPSVTLAEDGARWTAWSGGVPVATSRGGGLRVLLPPDIARRVAAEHQGVRLAADGVDLRISDAATAAFARSLLERRIDVGLFAWQYRSDGV